MDGRAYHSLEKPGYTALNDTHGYWIARLSSAVPLYVDATPDLRQLMGDESVALEAFGIERDLL